MRTDDCAMASDRMRMFTGTRTQRALAVLPTNADTHARTDRMPR